MLYFYYGTDRTKTREALARELAGAHGRIVRITDAHAAGDLEAALSGGGMFPGEQVVVLEGVYANPEHALRVARALPLLKASEERFYLLEEKLDAATRKSIEKHAEQSVSFDLPKRAEQSNIFSLANALRRGDKKALWIAYQRELRLGSAPEAIHGVLFWGAKDFALKSRTQSDATRARTLVAALAGLPHEARRAGEDLEYALERFVLSKV